MMFKRSWLFGRVYRNETDGDGGDTGGAPSVGVVENGPTNVDTDWAGISDDSGESSSDFVPAAGETPAVPATNVVEPAPVAPPVAAPAAPAVEPVVPPATTPAVEQTPAVENTPATGVPQTAEELAVLRTNYFNELVKDYQILPEDAARLQTEPENVLPVLAARVQMQVLDAVFSTLPQRVYAMINQHTQAVERENKAQSDMFTAYPALKDHKDAVLRAGQMYRAVNPKAPRDVALKAIGDYCMQILGLQNPVVPPAAVSTPANPFVPAQSSGAGGPPPAADEWGFLDDD